jgi:acetylornithine deacetylase/succinyl-diaminopimelate desuccinylase-like protein
MVRVSQQLGGKAVRGMLWVVGLIAAMVLVAALPVAFLKQPIRGRWVQPPDLRADPESLRRDVDFLTMRVFPRSVDHPEQQANAAAHIQEALAAAGARVAEQRYEFGGEEYRNIVGAFGPAGERPLIIGAHYDVFSDLPGADDNASGVAGLLELGRILARHAPPVPVELVAFANEEPPFFGTQGMGSWAHAGRLEKDRREIRGMISLEMIGYFTAEQPAPHLLLKLFYPRTGDFIAVAGRWGDYRLVRHVKKALLSAGQPTQAYAGPIMLGIDLSDHSSYWGHGYRAVMVTDTAFIRNPYYHTAQDTADRLDYDRMARVVEGIATAALHADVL